MATDDSDLDAAALELELVTQILSAIELNAARILGNLDPECPTDPVAIYAILKGEQRAPWPKKIASRGRERAKVAMHALLHVREARNHLTDPTRENARKAAFHALYAGAYSWDIVRLQDDARLGAKERAKQHARGVKRGQQQTAAASRHDPVIAKYLRKYASSELAQAEYSTPTKYIADMTPLSERTIQNVIKRLHRKR